MQVPSASVSLTRRWRQRVVLTERVLVIRNWALPRLQAFSVYVYMTRYIDDLEQDCDNSSALAMELPPSALSHRYIELLNAISDERSQILY